MKLSTGKIIYLVIAVLVIFFCGKNLLKDTKAMLNEIKENTVVYGQASLDEKNDGKLVLVSGKIDCETLTDEIFNVSVKTPCLRRDVQMYQYDVDGNDMIEYEWSTPNGETMTDSNGNDMLDNRGYILRNPETNLKAETYKGSGKIGDFNVDEEILFNINTETKGYETENESSVYYDGQRYYFVDGYFNTCRDAGREIVGDIRVKFTYKDLSNDETVTVLAKQSGNKLTFGETKDGTKIGMAVKGKESLETILNNIASSERSSKTFQFVIIAIVVVIGIFVFKKKEEKTE